MYGSFSKLLFVKSFFLFLLGVLLMGGLEYYFLDADLVVGNMGLTFYTIEIIFITLNSLLFGMFLALTGYKISYFSKKRSFFGFLGGLMGIIVSGCPSCSITLASYIGLAGIISVFPYSGIELKVLAFFLLLYAVFSTYKNLKTCSLK